MPSNHTRDIASLIAHSDLVIEAFRLSTAGWVVRLYSASAHRPPLVLHPDDAQLLAEDLQIAGAHKLAARILTARSRALQRALTQRARATLPEDRIFGRAVPTSVGAMVVDNQSAIDTASERKTT